MKLVALTKGFFAKVDDEDFHRVASHSWCVLDLRRRRNGLLYAQSRIGGKIIYLHRFVTAAKPGTEVDHKNGDGLDCRKRNLRVVTRLENSRNRRHLYKNNITGVTGVSFDRTRGKFKVDISVRGKTFAIGRFATLEDAAEARKKAEVTIWGRNWRTEEAVAS